MHLNRESSAFSYKYIRSYETCSCFFYSICHSVEEVASGRSKMLVPFLSERTLRPIPQNFHTVAARANDMLFYNVCYTSPSLTYAMVFTPTQIKEV